MYKFSSKFLDFKNLSTATSKPFLIDIVNLLDNEDYSEGKIKIILNKFNITNIADIKDDCLNFLISFADFILIDDIISNVELNDFSMLKKLFKIEEGDFKELKYSEIRRILEKQFSKMFSDNFINNKEEIMNINLQSLFDLSYDDFADIKEIEVKKSLFMGANLQDLDIAPNSQN